MYVPNIYELLPIPSAVLKFSNFYRLPQHFDFYSLVSFYSPQHTMIHGDTQVQCRPHEPYIQLFVVPYFWWKRPRTDGGRINGTCARWYCYLQRLDRSVYQPWFAFWGMRRVTLTSLEGQQLGDFFNSWSDYPDLENAIDLINRVHFSRGRSNSEDWETINCTLHRFN